MGWSWEAAGVVVAMKGSGDLEAGEDEVDGLEERLGVDMAGGCLDAGLGEIFREVGVDSL